MRSVTWVLMLTLLAVALAGEAHAQRNDGARVFLVLDGSGSMWGRVGEQTKMQVARDTVRTMTLEILQFAAAIIVAGMLLACAETLTGAVRGLADRDGARAADADGRHPGARDLRGPWPAC